MTVLKILDFIFHWWALPINFIFRSIQNEYFSIFEKNLLDKVRTWETRSEVSGKNFSLKKKDFAGLFPGNKIFPEQNSSKREKMRRIFGNEIFPDLSLTQIILYQFLNSSILREKMVKNIQFLNKKSHNFGKNWPFDHIFECISFLKNLFLFKEISILTFLFKEVFKFSFFFLKKIKFLIFF